MIRKIHTGIVYYSTLEVFALDSHERARLERVFFNLIANAPEAIPQGGTIHITEQMATDSVFIQFADTGPGILPSIRARLFEPFVSAGKKNGLGLGLALSRQTVIDQGGEIWVEEGAPGARFVVRLPLRKMAMAVR